MEQLITLFGLAILMTLLVVIYLLLNNKQKKEGDDAQLLFTWLNAMKKELNQSDLQNRQEMQQRLDFITEQISRHQQSTSGHLLRQHNDNKRLIQDISTKLATIDGTNQQILGFASQMKSLEKILQSPKQRGVLGEYFLEHILANILPPNQYSMQYTFSNGYIVDAAIFVKDKIVPVDAKFSLERYNRMMQTSNLKQRQQFSKQFRTDIKNRINETAKYIMPHENTTDFALMFVPAEGIYYWLLTNQVAEKDLISYALTKNVILVSPTSFYAYLKTILQGLKALEIEHSVKEVIKKVELLGKHLNSYEQHLERVGKHLQTAQNAHQQATKEFGKIDKDVARISKLGINDLKSTKTNKSGQKGLF
ncbi:MAG: DNA recombination protein RmuC [Chitinophagales bacterium]